MEVKVGTWQARVGAMLMVMRRGLPKVASTGELASSEPLLLVET